MGLWSSESHLSLNLIISLMNIIIMNEEYNDCTRGPTCAETTCQRLALFKKCLKEFKRILGKEWDSCLFHQKSFHVWSFSCSLCLKSLSIWNWWVLIILRKKIEVTKQNYYQVFEEIVKTIYYHDQFQIFNWLLLSNDEVFTRTVKCKVCYFWHNLFKGFSNLVV